MLRIKAVIFDFDGVIVASERVKFNKLAVLLKSKDLCLRREDFADMIGKKTGKFLEEKFGNLLASADIKSIVDQRRQDQIQNLRDYCKPIPGARKFIFNLHKRGILLCIATGTNRSILVESLRMLNLAGKFQVIVSGDQFTSSKPDPEVYRLAIRKLCLPANAILVIEDSPSGVLAAKRTGLTCVAISIGKKAPVVAGADIVVHSFREIQKLFFDD